MEDEINFDDLNLEKIDSYELDFEDLNDEIEHQNYDETSFESYDKFLEEEVFSNLPQLLKDLTAPYLGRDREIVLFSSIGVISACLPNVYGIYDSSELAANLYLMVVAPPASGKGMLSKARLLIEPIHHYVKVMSEFEIEECDNLNDELKKEGKKPSVCPDLEVKIIPGNVSSAKIYKHIKNSKNGLLIFESEADSLSQMFKNEWGSFSDILRKTFHHEPISISRQNNDTFIEVELPKLSLVVAGTPNQVQPLIQSRENGLFSRFIYYYFNEPSYWKDVSPKGQKINTNKLFREEGAKLLKLYKKLLNNPKPVEFQLSDSQWNDFNQLMSSYTTSMIFEKYEDNLPIIKRQGVIFFRIAMILTVIRNIDEDFEKTNVLICNDDDFETALAIVRKTIDYSLVVSKLLSRTVNTGKDKLNSREITLLGHLNGEFTRTNALEIAERLKIPERTLGHILKKLVKYDFIERVSQGKYKKM